MNCDVAQMEEINADLAMYGRNGALLIVDAKIRVLSEAERHDLLSWWQQFLTHRDDVLLAIVDLERIIFFQHSPTDPNNWTQVLNVSTVDTLAVYDPDLRTQAAREPRGFLYRPYLERLVEAWLRDVVFQWSGGPPPYRAVLQDMGFGTVFSDVELVRETLIT